MTRYKRNRILPILAITLAAIPLCECSNEMANSFFVDPAKYTLYNCEALAREARDLSLRQRQIEMLITQAGTDAGGRLVSGMTYQPEYVKTRGQMELLRKTAAEKNCNLSEGGSSPAR